MAAGPCRVDRAEKHAKGCRKGLEASKSVLCQQSPEVPSAGKPFLPGRNSSWKFLGGHLLCWLLLLTNYTDLIKGCTKERKQSIPIVWLDGDSGFRLLFYSHFGKTLQDASVFAMSYISSEDFGEKGTVCLPYTVSSVLGEHGDDGQVWPHFEGVCNSRQSKVW